MKRTSVFSVFGLTILLCACSGGSPSTKNLNNGLAGWVLQTHDLDSAYAQKKLEIEEVKECDAVKNQHDFERINQKLSLPNGFVGDDSTKNLGYLCDIYFGKNKDFEVPVYAVQSKKGGWFAMPILGASPQMDENVKQVFFVY